MLKFLKTFWIQVAVLDFDFDLEGNNCIDVLSIVSGTAGIAFSGSLFQLYYSPADKYGNKSQLTGDFLYLEQLLHTKWVKDVRAWWKL